jgi:hypothetical protein
MVTSPMLCRCSSRKSADPIRFGLRTPVERRSELRHSGSIPSRRVSPRLSPFNKVHHESGNSPAGAGATVNDAQRAGIHPASCGNPDKRCKLSRMCTYEIGVPNYRRMNTYTKTVGGGGQVDPGEIRNAAFAGPNQHMRKRGPKLCRMNTYANYPGGCQPPGKALSPPFLIYTV